MTQPFHNPSILIVDDESDICYLLGNILKQKKITSVFATSLSEADDIMEHESGFSFIFLDNHLPDGSGIDHIKQIKKKCPQSKIIMVTAQDDKAARDKASKEGADFFIGKPFSSELILKTINRLVT